MIDLSPLSWIIIVIASFISGGMVSTIFWWVQTGEWKDDDED